MQTLMTAAEDALQKSEHDNFKRGEGEPNMSTGNAEADELREMLVCSDMELIESRARVEKLEKTLISKDTTIAHLRKMLCGEPKSPVDSMTTPVRIAGKRNVNA